MDSLMEKMLQLIKKKMREQGAYDRDSYKEFIEETIEYYRTKGEITDDDNDEFFEDQLLDLYDDVKNNLIKKSSR